MNKYKGYQIYDVNNETIFVYKTDMGYTVWSIGYKVDDYKKVIDNIDDYINIGGSVLVDTQAEVLQELERI